MKDVLINIKKYFVFSLFLITVTLQAQVGVFTNDPKSSLDIRSSSQSSPTNTDGLLIPTIDAFPTTNPTGLKDGMLVFFKGNTLQSRGFYYWDATLDMWVLYGGINRIHQLNDGISYFVNTTDAGTNVFLGEIETVRNNFQSYNTAVGFKTHSAYSNPGFPYSYATGVGYNSSYSADTTQHFHENSTIFGYHDSNAYIAEFITSNQSFAHVIKTGDGERSLAIGRQYGASIFEIMNTTNFAGVEAYGEYETYIGSYFGFLPDAGSGELLYFTRQTTLGFDYETLPAEPLNSSKLFYDSGNDILQCRAKDVLRGINHSVRYNHGSGNGGYTNHSNMTISLGYRESYAFNMTSGGFSFSRINQNISLGYLAHDNLAFTNNSSDEYINNLAIGSYALYSSETVSNSIAFGENALRQNTSDDNIAIGKDAMSQHSFGIDNTVLGSDAFFRNISGTDNVALGKSAGYYVSGDENTFVGAFASNGTATHFKNGNIKIGSFSGYLDTNADRLYIENSTGNTPLIGGDFIYKTVGINRNINNLFNTFEVGGTASNSVGGNWLANSDGRLKKNILDISSTAALNRITKLKGVTYFWNDTQTGNQRPDNIQYGFIAQDLMQVFPEHVVKDKQGFYQTAYGTYDAFVVEAIKELQTKYDTNESKLDDLEVRLNRIKSILKNTNTTLQKDIND
mgnify:CR=1 FL=1